MAVRELLLWHPDSPGVRVPVRRGVLGRLFKPRDFATLGEVLSYHRRQSRLSGGQLGYLTDSRPSGPECLTKSAQAVDPQRTKPTL
ncbi:MAG: hypothetical protein ACYC0T_21395 [Ramlibacter sp.]